LFTILLILKGNMRVTSSQPVEKPNHGKQIKTLDSSFFYYLRCCMEAGECKNNISSQYLHFAKTEDIG
jgi:hypothetical protein